MPFTIPNQVGDPTRTMVSAAQLVEQATAATNTAEDWGTIIALCERASAAADEARAIVGAVARRIAHRNVNVALYALTVANALVQNGTGLVHREISSRTFVDALVQVLTRSAACHPVLRERILEMLQTWAELFRTKPELAYLVEAYEQLRRQNFVFPSRDAHTKAQVVTASMLAKQKEEEELQLALALSLSQSEQGGAEAMPSRHAASPVHGHGAARDRPKVLFQVRALYPFQPREEGELAIRDGQIYDVFDATTFGPWWKGAPAQPAADGSVPIGIFPSNHVEMLQTAASAAFQMAGGAGPAQDPVDGFDPAAAAATVDRLAVLSQRHAQRFPATHAGAPPDAQRLAAEAELHAALMPVLALQGDLHAVRTQVATRKQDLDVLHQQFLHASSILDTMLHQLRQQAAQPLPPPQPAPLAPPASGAPHPSYGPPPPAAYAPGYHATYGMPPRSTPAGYPPS
ncbi:hypothetical protein CXG81DRAFT_23269 [Caulochytrium protostelioides]|uniref:Class E vacuolar protein-sorting machinery protein HSE1 n=1 Tax=Caulochytrium protostelioides TaxID=1555241 RepID=A0A4P9XF14_9FUNG|nr:hypothetical protein CXG81DRAFT_23269 [Caulochytrium protostelioides]|eukprot:RKP04163.1 hypothetical protein CXG81DRAFT_23269 [Caulochytrium protostelioides]